jgi:polyisoprenyl-teichoic acid--peptidoglycan teichoic acid transferase
VTERPATEGPETERPETERPATARRRPVVAALLSFLLPGLGQIWAGRPRRGLLFLLPIAVVVALFAIPASRSLAYLVGLLLQPPVLIALIVGNLLFIGYRILAIVDAYRVAQARAASAVLARRTRVARTALIGLAVLVIATHGTLAFFSYQAYDLVTGVFDDGGPDTGFDPDSTSPPSPSSSMQSPPVGEPSGGPPTPSPTPASTPLPSGWAADGRLNILLLGGDAGPGRFGLRTDTIILASVEVETGRAALFGIPRNLKNVPLPAESAGAFGCGCFPNFFFGLYRYASDHPRLFPGDDAHRGLRAVAGAVEELTGVELDGLVLVDLHGFIELIDALGGVDINVARRIVDNAYPKEDGSGAIRIVIEPGLQHMDGVHALRYARTRHQDSDYGRMRRQQQVLVALRHQLNVCALIPRIPELVQIAKRTLTTDIPASQLPGLLELAAKVDADRISKDAFNPPGIREALRAQDIRAIHQRVAEVFNEPAPPPEEEPPDDGPC